MATIKVGDQYIEKSSGIILTVTKVLIAEDEEYNLIEYVIFDTVKNHAVPSYKLKQLCVKVVQTEAESEDGDAESDEAEWQKLDNVKYGHSGAKWIAKNGNGHIYVYESKPLAHAAWEMWVLQTSGKGEYVPRMSFPEVYKYFADIPWDESLTEL